MQEKLFYLEQIALIKEWAAERTPLLNFLFKLLSFFDTELFSVILVSILFLGYKRIWGIRMAYMYYITYFFNHSLKHLFQLPRPSFLVPEIALDHFYGYGFPSGGAQSAAVVFGLLALMSKNRFRWVLAFIGMISIALSRVYIGAHFFTDVIAGLLVGGILVVGFYYFHEAIETFFQKTPKKIRLATIGILSLILLLSFPTSGTIRCSAAFLGMSLGLFFSQMLQLTPVDSKNMTIKVIRVAYGLAILGGLHFFFQATSSTVTHYKPFSELYMPHFLIGLWLSLGTAWFLKNHEALNR